MSKVTESTKVLGAYWKATKFFGRFSERLGGHFAARLWFTPWAVDSSERSLARHARWLQGAERITVPFEGRDLSGFSAGQGPTILLVHGWGERAATLGALVAPLVDRGFRVVGVDLPAHGDSPGNRTDLIEEARAVRSTIEHLGGVHTVIAHSMGGAVTTLALSEGARVERVVFIASALRLENAVDVFAASFGLSARAERGLRNYIERRFGSGVWTELAVDTVAREIDIPALVFHDREDEQIAFADGKALAATWPNARFVETEGWGHVKILGNPDVIEKIGDWLTGAERKVSVG